MYKNNSLAKSIQDAAWNQVNCFTAYKAACAGRLFVEVEPRHTSQDCHKCGHRRTDLTLADRVYHCTNPECLLVMDRDHNAALVRREVAISTVQVTSNYNT